MRLAILSDIHGNPIALGYLSAAGWLDWLTNLPRTFAPRARGS